jgi:hypothetical protein
MNEIKKNIMFACTIICAAIICRCSHSDNDPEPEQSENDTLRYSYVVPGVIYNNGMFSGIGFQLTEEKNHIYTTQESGFTKVECLTESFVDVDDERGLDLNYGTDFITDPDVVFKVTLRDGTVLFYKPLPGAITRTEHGIDHILNDQERAVFIEKLNKAASDMKYFNFTARQ